MADVGARLHASNTKSKSGEACKSNTDPNPDEIFTPRPVTAKERDAITERLSSAHTKAWTGEPCKTQPVVATPKEATMTKAYEVEDMVDRLATTHTKAWSAEPCRAQPVVADNSIAKDPVPEREMTEIFKRLNTTHTKATEPTACKPYEPPKTPGLGQKCLPDIDGLDARFKGKRVDSAKAGNIFSRLSSASTKSSRARYDNAKILLYPERTLLCNNVERIVNYQNTGSVVKQDTLARREKWFN